LTSFDSNGQQNANTPSRGDGGGVARPSGGGILIRPDGSMGGGIPRADDQRVRGERDSSTENSPVSSHNDPCHTRDRGLPALVKRATFGETGRGLDTNNSALMELFDGASTGVGAGTAHASNDRVDEVFNAGAVGLEI